MTPKRSRRGAWRCLPLLLALCLLLGLPARAALFGAADLRALSDAITEIDLERAQKLAASIDSETPQFLLERGRLLLYLGDCVGAAAVFWTGLMQGLGAGSIIGPLGVMTFTTLPPRHRTEAASIWNLVRSIGSSIGIATALAILVRTAGITGGADA